MVEVVIALGIVAFALIAMLGVMSTSLVTHQDATEDSVFTVMTESAMQEVRNVGFIGPTPNSGGTDTPTPLSTAKNYYMYFDGNGEITVDGAYSASGPTPATNSGPTSTSFETTTTAANMAAEPGIPLAITGTANPPLTGPAVPAGTVYLCTITVSNPTLAQASTVTTNLFLVKMVFSWPATAPIANQRTRTVVASLSNNY